DAVRDRAQHVLRVLEVRGDDPDLEGPRLEVIGDLADPPRELRQGADLRVEVAEEPGRLELGLGFRQHELVGLALDQLYRVELRIEGSGDRVCLRERLPDEGEAGR